MGTAVPPPLHEWHTVRRDPPQEPQPRRSPSLHLVQKHSTYPLPPQVSHSLPCASLSLVCENNLYAKKKTPAQSNVEAYSERSLKDRAELIDASGIPENPWHNMARLSSTCLAISESNMKFQLVLWRRFLSTPSVHFFTEASGRDRAIKIWGLKILFSFLPVWIRCPRQDILAFWTFRRIQKQLYHNSVLRLQLVVLLRLEDIYTK